MRKKQTATRHVTEGGADPEADANESTRTDDDVVSVDEQSNPGAGDDMAMVPPAPNFQFDDQGNAILLDGTPVVEPSQVEEVPAELVTVQIEMNDGTLNAAGPMTPSAVTTAPSSSVTTTPTSAAALGMHSGWEPGVMDVVKCTCCSTKVNPYAKPIEVHPVLKVIMCKRCYKFYGQGDFQKDVDGKDNHCRWCAEGGTIVCCDFCHNAFCKKCIKRNLGRSALMELEELDDDQEWKCYTCNSKPIASMQQECAQVLERVQVYHEMRKRRSARSRGKTQPATSAVRVSGADTAAIAAQTQAHMIVKTMMMSPNYTAGSPRLSIAPKQPAVMMAANARAQYQPRPNTGVRDAPLSVQQQLGIAPPHGQQSNRRGTAGTGMGVLSHEWYQENVDINSILNEVQTVTADNIRASIASTRRCLDAFSSDMRRLDTELMKAKTPQDTACVVRSFQSIFRFHLFLRLGKLATRITEEIARQQKIASLPINQGAGRGVGAPSSVLHGATRGPTPQVVRHPTQNIQRFSAPPPPPKNLTIDLTADSEASPPRPYMNAPSTSSGVGTRRSGLATTSTNLFQNAPTQVQQVVAEPAAESSTSLRPKVGQRSGIKIRLFAKQKTIGSLNDVQVISDSGDTDEGEKSSSKLSTENPMETADQSQPSNEKEEEKANVDEDDSSLLKAAKNELDKEQDKAKNELDKEEDKAKNELDNEQDKAKNEPSKESTDNDVDIADPPEPSDTKEGEIANIMDVDSPREETEAELTESQSKGPSDSEAALETTEPAPVVKVKLWSCTSPVKSSAKRKGVHGQKRDKAKRRRRENGNEAEKSDEDDSEEEEEDNDEAEGDANDKDSDKNGHSGNGNSGSGSDGGSGGGGESNNKDGDENNHEDGNENDHHSSNEEQNGDSRSQGNGATENVENMDSENFLNAPQIRANDLALFTLEATVNSPDMFGNELSDGSLSDDAAENSADKALRPVSQSPKDIVKALLRAEAVSQTLQPAESCGVSENSNDETQSSSSSLTSGSKGLSREVSDADKQAVQSVEKEVTVCSSQTSLPEQSLAPARDVVGLEDTRGVQKKRKRSARKGKDKFRLRLATSDDVNAERLLSSDTEDGEAGDDENSDDENELARNMLLHQDSNMSSDSENTDRLDLSEVHSSFVEANDLAPPSAATEVINRRDLNTSGISRDIERFDHRDEDGEKLPLAEEKGSSDNHMNESYDEFAPLTIALDEVHEAASNEDHLSTTANPATQIEDVEDDNERARKKLLELMELCDSADEVHEAASNEDHLSTTANPATQIDHVDDDERARKKLFELMELSESADEVHDAASNEDHLSTTANPATQIDVSAGKDVLDSDDSSAEEDSSEESETSSSVNNLSTTANPLTQIDKRSPSKETTIKDSPDAPVHTPVTRHMTANYVVSSSESSDDSKEKTGKVLKPKIKNFIIPLRDAVKVLQLEDLETPVNVNYLTRSEKIALGMNWRPIRANTSGIEAEINRLQKIRLDRSKRKSAPKHRLRHFKSSISLDCVSLYVNRMVCLHY